MTRDIFARNNVTMLGQGRQPMLFAHGFGCDQNMWRYVAPAFADSHQVILFDYVGSGQSDLAAYKPERYSQLSGYAQDVLEICAALDLKDLVFVGHSVSAMIGVLASLQATERFSRLVMLGPSPCYINDADYVGGFSRSDIAGLLDMMDKNFLGWAGFLAPVIMQNPDRPELSRELEASFCSTDPVIARRFAEATFYSDNRADLPGVSIPSLIVQCSEDAIAPRSVGEYLLSHLPGSTLQLLEAHGHCPHLSHPQETICLMREYLHAAS